jgi:two-component system CheB/CheR fusion protein
MPAGAIATGAVDLVLPAEDMPRQLLGPRDRGDPALDLNGASAEDLDAARLEICAIVRNGLGHDFSGYRDKTFMRRVRRRMQALNLTDLRAYIARLERDHDEAVLLFRDLLIRVTSFFRDANTFDVIERLVIPRLFAGKHADAAVRVWVPGCATGEEAYSLAILLREQIERQRGTPKVQVFATDIDEPAIATARLGRYPPTLLDGMDPARRDRFFHASPAGYAAVKEIRDLCTFSPHSIVRDPPFSRIDLISCRNLLIYMDTDQQAAIIPAFHYALVPGGMLLLGSSESVARHEDLFEPLDKAARLFRKREVPNAPAIRLPGDADQRPLDGPNAATPTIARSKPRGVRGTGRDTAEPDMIGIAAQDKMANAPADVATRMRGGIADALRAALRRLAPGGSGQHPLDELESTREQLRSITEEHQTALEEIRSANEELHSVNEELQSSNEELETSKEELQSVNEELNTVNARLSEKVDELDRANSDLRNLLDSTQIATVFLDRHLIIRGFTPAVGNIYNLIPSDHGRPLTDIVSRLRYDGLRADVATVLDTLLPLERRVTRDDGRMHYLMRILPYRSRESVVSGTLVTFLDVSSIVKAEEHQRLLVDELNHRVKNMLTVVISLASQTLRRSATLEEFSESFIGRVRALTASYTLLSGEKWLGVSLRDLLVEETRPDRAESTRNIVMEGPEIRLSAAGALAMGMAIHELATNAVKHGALSAPEGVVTISWRLETDGEQAEFVLRWIETGGPPVVPPERRGFGITLIERGFAHELSGHATMAFEPEGVRATLRAPARTALANDPDFGYRDEAGGEERGEDEGNGEAG